MFDLNPFLILKDGLMQDKKKYGYYSYYGKTQHNISSSMGMQDCIIFPNRFRIA